MSQTPDTLKRRRVVVIGAGFGGLAVVRGLAHAPVDVLVIDRNNYHGFWPLLYQVATAGLEPQQIAQPVRAIIRRSPNISFRLATVESIDRARRVVITDQAEFPYDELVVAPGSATNFFGLEAVAAHSFELKDVSDSLAIRNHMLLRFEQAAAERDPERLRRMLTFVVVGGGPTGVEMAGAITELIRHVLRKDFPTLDFRNVRVTLVEAADRLLLAFPATLAAKAQRKLLKLGVEIRLNTSVVGFENDRLQLKDGSTLATETVIWAAGVQGAPLGAQMGEPLQRGARIAVTPELHLPDDPSVWVIGDLAYLPGPDGRPYPQLATVAMQQGRLVTRNLLSKLRGQPLRAFRYVDKGSMATVGRRSAVAQIWGLRFSGAFAWWIWLAVHLFYLIGFRNRVLVLINWAYNYFTYERGARALVQIGPAPIANKANPETEAAEPETLQERDWAS